MEYTSRPVSLGTRSLEPPLKWSGDQLINPPGPQYAIRNDPRKLKVEAKHRLLMLNTCSVDECFQNPPADLRHISSPP